jgi:hypothetical protein
MNTFKHHLYVICICCFVIMIMIPIEKSQAGDITPIYKTASITVDGKMSDWPTEATYYLKDQQAVVGFSHDSAKLYVMLRFNKTEYERMVRMSGLTLLLDAKGKKGKDFKLKFIGGPSKEEMKTATVDSKSGQDNRMPPGMQMDRENKLLFYQKDVIAEKEIPINGSEGPSVASGVDKGFFVYEFSIPLSKSSVRNYGLGVSPDQAMSIGLIWGEMDRDAMRGSGQPPEGMGGNMPSGGGPGGGGPGGGGPGGGGPGGGPGGDMGQRKSEKQEIWFQAKITSASSEKEAKTNK